MALVTLWEFNDPANVLDDVTADGTAQDGSYFSGATAVGGQGIFDGVNDHVVIPPDPGLELNTGTIAMQFTLDTMPSSRVGLFSADSTGFNDGDFTMWANGDGSISIRHQNDTASFNYSSPTGFFGAGDDVRVTYSWDSTGTGGAFTVENLSAGTSFSQPITDPLIFNGDGDEAVVIGANAWASGEGTADNLREFMDGTVDYVSISDTIDSSGPPPCFTTGALIGTPSGPRAVETLKVGDEINTLDAGPQKIRWIGSQQVLARGASAPVRIRAGSFGNTRDMLVSPQHRILLRSRNCELLFGASEVFASAKDLIDGVNVIVDNSLKEITYFHILLDQHHVVFCEDAPTESLYLGAQSLALFDQSARTEIQGLFGDISANDPCGSHSNTARPVLKAHEVKMLLSVRSEFSAA